MFTICTKYGTLILDKDYYGGYIYNKGKEWKEEMKNYGK